VEYPTEERPNQHSSGLPVALGTTIRLLHFGHLPFLPAYTSGTLIFLPQLLQRNLILAGISGTTQTLLHFGHFTRLPRSLSDALICRPQLSQLKLTTTPPADSIICTLPDCYRFLKN